MARVGLAMHSVSGYEKVEALSIQHDEPRFERLRLELENFSCRNLGKGSRQIMALDSASIWYLRIWIRNGVPSILAERRHRDCGIRQQCFYPVNCVFWSPAAGQQIRPERGRKIRCYWEKIFFDAAIYACAMSDDEGRELHGDGPLPLEWQIETRHKSDEMIRCLVHVMELRQDRLPHWCPIMTL